MVVMDLKFNSSRFAELRAAQGFTQESFAKEMKVSRQTVINWEKGHANPDLDTVNKMGKKLGIGGMFLLQGNQP